MAGWHKFGRRRWWAGASMALALMTTALPPAAAGDSGGDGGVVFPGGELEATSTEAAPVSPRRPVDPSEAPVLAEPAAGQEALDQVGDRLGEVAARNGMSPADLEDLLLSDDTAHLDRYGFVFFVDPAPDTAPRADVDAAPAAAPFPYEDTFSLNSKPGSKRVVYLDFNGHTLPASNGWRAGVYTALAYDTNGAPGTFSNDEMDVIQSIWQRVAEDFAPFDVNVTTAAPAFDAINRSSASDLTYGTRAVITNTADTEICGFCGGVAYLGVFDIYGDFAPHSYFQPAWCFAGSLSGDTKAMAECVSHEVGHNMGLDHDGRELFGDYYAGHEPWAPIMGVSYYEPVTQWSKGDYDGATNTEDDFAVMASHGVKQRSDDHTNVDTTATVLLSSRTGVVSSKDDYDLFSFTASESGSVTFVAEPAPVSPNLDVVLDSVLRGDGPARHRRTTGGEGLGGRGNRDGRLAHPHRRSRSHLLPPGARRSSPDADHRVSTVRVHRCLRARRRRDDRAQFVRRPRGHHPGNDGRRHHRRDERDRRHRRPGR